MVEHNQKCILLLEILCKNDKKKIKPNKIFVTFKKLIVVGVHFGD